MNLKTIAEHSVIKVYVFGSTDPVYLYVERSEEMADCVRIFGKKLNTKLADFHYSNSTMPILEYLYTYKNSIEHDLRIRRYQFLGEDDREVLLEINRKLQHCMSLLSEKINPTKFLDLHELVEFQDLDKIRQIHNAASSRILGSKIGRVYY